MSNYAVDRQAYIADAEMKFRIPAEQIVKILDEEFGGFKPSGMKVYDERLEYIRSQRKMNQGNPNERVPAFIEGAKCPVCGSQIRHNRSWRSKDKNMQPFSCERTKIAHYLQWRTSFIAQRFKEHYEKYPEQKDSIAGAFPYEKLENQEPEPEHA
jgi:hypothetical protein